MSTLFNYWHYGVLGVIVLFFLAGVIFTYKRAKPKLVMPMLFSITLISIVIALFSVAAVDKYTKVAKLYKLENKRILSIEKIIYSGIVRNEGDYKIGKVTFEIKLVNKGRATAGVKGTTFYEPTGFLNFFSGGAGILYKPQQITKKFVVAQGLKPGEAKSFRVYFDYPPYFRNVSHFAKLSAH